MPIKKSCTMLSELQQEEVPEPQDLKTVERGSCRNILQQTILLRTGSEQLRMPMYIFKVNIMLSYTVFTSLCYFDSVQNHCSDNF